MRPAEVVSRWVDRFNAADIEGLLALYAPDAINHQVVTKPLRGKDEIGKLFEVEFGRAKMVCIPVKLHEAGIVAIRWRTMTIT